MAMPNAVHEERWEPPLPEQSKIVYQRFLQTNNFSFLFELNITSSTREFVTLFIFKIFNFFSVG